MHHAHRRVGLVDVLTARAAGALGLHDQIFRTDLDLDLIVELRHDIERGKRSVPSSARVERRDAHQTVHALLRFQIAVCLVSLHQHGDRLDAGFFSRQIIQHGDLEALLFGITGIHAVQHAAPVA